MDLYYGSSWWAECSGRDYRTRATTSIQLAAFTILRQFQNFVTATSRALSLLVYSAVIRTVRCSRATDGSLLLSTIDRTLCLSLSVSLSLFFSFSPNPRVSSTREPTAWEKSTIVNVISNIIINFTKKILYFLSAEEESYQRE